MSANAPAEARPVARNCPICGKELPAEAEKCSSCEAATPATRLCPVCTKELPLRAQKCLACGEYVNWQGKLTSAKGILALAATVVSLVAGIFGVIAMWPAGSRTEMIKIDPSSDATLLVVHVKNSGKKDSRVYRDFTLTLAEKNILRFGSLTLVSPETWTVIPQGETAKLELEIADIELMSVVRRKEFGTRYGKQLVTLRGKVIESNGKEHALIQNVLLNELLPFFEHRIVWPSPGRDS